MLISLTGNINSGKDTVANYLVSNHNFIQLSFAESLKDALTAIFGWDRDMLEGKTKEHRETRNKVDVWWSKELNIPNLTPRLALTMVGTDIIRKHFNDYIWVLSLKNKIIHIRKVNPKANIVVSDVRYINELSMLSEDFDAVLVNIIRLFLPDWWESALTYNSYDSDFKRLICKLYYKHLSKSPNIFNRNIHSSEYDWIGYTFDHVVLNNDSLETLYTNIDRFLGKE